ncbi:MAG: nucleotidyltransferase family protein [Planctomycetaceae bacterium]|nr:nucleotidyltransferase family protein [Planctomycetaceae bacterium]
MNTSSCSAGEQSLSAVIPAAGLSRRMGRPKLLLPLGDQPVLARLLNGLPQAGFGRCVVVIRAEDNELQDVARGCGATVVCPEVDPPDMRTSVEHALKCLEQEDSPHPGAGWALVPADHPVLDHQPLEQLVACWGECDADILAPVYQGRRGHPTIFRWSLVPEVFALPPETGLNQLMKQPGRRIRELPVDSPGVLTDLDTPEDYQRLRALFGE